MIGFILRLICKMRGGHAWRVAHDKMGLMHLKCTRCGVSAYRVKDLERV
jgi:ribosomal protein L37E